MLSDIYDDILAFYHILSDISVDILSGVASGLPPRVLSHNPFDVLFGTSSDALSSGVLSVIVSAIQTGIHSDIVSSSLAFYLACSFAFYLTYIPTFLMKCYIYIYMAFNRHSILHSI